MTDDSTEGITLKEKHDSVDDIVTDESKNGIIEPCQNEKSQQVSYETQVGNSKDDEMFDPDVKITYDSDVEIAENSSKSSRNEPDISSDSSSESDSSDEDVSSEDIASKVGDGDEDDNEVADEGPILSKNEVLEETVDTLPADYKIEPDTSINYVGTISGVVEKSVIIKAAVSAEERVLDTGTVFCFEDRTPLGYLYEVFGRLQSPVYRVKFNTEDEVEIYKEMKGRKVFFIQPSAHFLWTKQIKQMRGTDASNANDEELPEDEQEFSDDEQEAAAKRAKNKRKNKAPKAAGDKKQKVGPSKPSNMFTSLPSGTPSQQQNNSCATEAPSAPTSGPQPPVDINAVAVMQSFLQIFQQANAPAQPAAPPLQHMQNEAAHGSDKKQTAQNMPVSHVTTQPFAQPQHQQQSHAQSHSQLHGQSQGPIPGQSQGTLPGQPNIQNQMYYQHYPNMYQYPQQYMPPVPQQHYGPYYGYQQQHYHTQGYPPQMFPQHPMSRPGYQQQANPQIQAHMPQTRPPHMPPQYGQHQQQHQHQHQHQHQQQHQHQHQKPQNTHQVHELSHNQHLQSPNQTNPALILAQLSGGVAPPAKNAGETPQSKENQSDDGN